MRNILKGLILSVISIMIISCGKTKMEDLSFTKGERDEVCVTKGSRPYSGDFWSNDGKTFKMTTNDYGIIQSVSMYHPNDKLALYCPLGSDGYFNTSNMECYDENGYRIDRHEWDKKYDSYFGSMWDRFVPKELKDAMR